MELRVIAISDTHGMHNALALRDADILIHSGDFSMRGGVGETLDFLDWYATQEAVTKIFICGNHDFVGVEHRTWLKEEALARNLIYLEDELVTVKGVNIYGSPITPTFGKWAFMRNRGEAIARVWDNIPVDVDILITHGPAYGVLDACPANVGCEQLALAIERVSPAFHVFGHIHEQGGSQETVGPTTFINCSISDRWLCPYHQPQTFTIYNDPHERNLFI